MFSSAIHDRSESRPARLPNGRPACIGPGRRGHELHELRTVSQPIDAPELPGARPPVHVTRTCPPKVRAYRRCDQVALCFESASKHVVISGALVRDLRCAAARDLLHSRDASGRLRVSRPDDTSLARRILPVTSETAPAQEQEVTDVEAWSKSETRGIEAKEGGVAKALRSMLRAEERGAHDAMQQCTACAWLGVTGGTSVFKLLH